MDTILDHRGYGVKYDQMGIKNQKKHVNALTFTPQLDYTEGKPPVPVPIYQRGLDRLWMPKKYGIKQYGIPTVNNERVGEDVDIAFTGILKPAQQEVVDDVFDIIIKDGGGQLCLPTGFGKTVIAIYLASLLKKKVLWITHQTNLLEQSSNSFERFTGCKPGIIQGSKIETDSPVVMGMLQSISKKEYDPKVFDDFGLVIFDEVHRVPSAVFSRALQKVSTKYMLGLSATPKRKDGLEKIIETCIGPIIAQVDLQIKIPLVRIMPVKYADKMKIRKNYNGDKINIPAMVTDICKDPVRNSIIVELLTEISKTGRNILVLTERRGHAEVLANSLKEKEIDVGLYLGQMKAEELAESNSKSIIIGTYAMCSTGYDNPLLNTVALATSKRDIRQTVGRILGLRSDGNFEPMIVDFTDTYGSFKTQAYARKKYYKEQNFKIL